MLEKGLLKHIEAVIQTTKPDDSQRISINNRRLLTNKSLLKIKAKYKKRNNPSK